jgi:hypothetical protein
MKEEGRKMVVKGWGGLKSKMECMGGRDYHYGRRYLAWGPRGPLSFSDPSR